MTSRACWPISAVEAARESERVDAERVAPRPERESAIGVRDMDHKVWMGGPKDVLGNIFVPTNLTQ